jgi:hypothetical protein
VTFRGKVLWAWAEGTASAHNSFTGYHRGEDLDLRGDLGLVSPGALLDLELTVRFERSHRLGLHSLYGGLTGHTVLDRTIEYNDNIFQAGEHARTALDLDIRDLDYSYEFPPSGDLRFRAGAGGRWSHMNVGFDSTTLDPAGSMEENTAIFPTLNAALAVDWTPSLVFEVELRGSPAALPFGFSHASLGRFVEINASLGWKISDAFRLEVGGHYSWFWQRWQGRESDGHYAVNYVDLMLLGPWIGLEISF